MSTDVSVTLSVVEGSHVIFISALREMSRQARHDRYRLSKNIKSASSASSADEKLDNIQPAKLSFHLPFSCFQLIGPSVEGQLARGGGFVVPSVFSTLQQDGDGRVSL